MRRFIQPPSRAPQTENDIFFKVVRLICLVAFGLAFASPFLWTVSTSLKELSDYKCVHAICKKPVERAKLLHHVMQIWDPELGVHETTDLGMEPKEPVIAL